MRVPSAFARAQEALRCPVCRQPLALDGRSLRCAKAHCYDLAARGYVNLVLRGRPAHGYDAHSFRSRQRLLAGGFYDHILQAVVAALQQAGARRIVDAGCGEGSLTARVRQALGAQVWGLDYAKESIQLAAGQDKAVGWLVADLADMPIQDGWADAVLNLFAPANYAEFRRALRPGGLVLKVAPGPGHLKELRQAAAGMLPQPERPADQVADHFARHCRLVSRQSLGRTLPIGGEQLEDLLRMTPLLFDRDRAQVDRGAITSITIQGELLVGQCDRGPFAPPSA